MTYNPNTRITRQDLKFFPSERLTDNDDGGGMPLGTPISGAANELFDPVTTYDRAGGAWTIRLAYAGLQRNDAAPMYGAYFAITKPAQDPAVTYLAMRSGGIGEIRTEMVKSITDNLVIDDTAYLPAGNVIVNELAYGEESQHTVGDDVIKIDSKVPIVFNAGNILWIQGTYTTTANGTSQQITYGELVKIDNVVATESEHSQTSENGVIYNNFKMYHYSITIKKQLTKNYTYDYILQNGITNVEKATFKNEIFKTRMAGQARFYGAKPVTSISTGSKSITVTSAMSHIAPQVAGVVVDVDDIEVLRLPADGLTQILQDDDEILIINSQKESIGSAHTANATVSLSRNNVNRICLTDANGVPVNAELWSYDLAIGSITWAASIDLSAYEYPLYASHSIEELNRITSVTTGGAITLLFNPLHNYPSNNTFVSSTLALGDLQVRHSVPFTQRNWDNEWLDEPKGDQLLNTLNLNQYPMVLTDDSAITDRIMIRMLSSSQLEVFGEKAGYLGKHDTLTDVVLTNPVTGKNILVIPKEAFGGTVADQAPWASQDVIRFNIFAAMSPVRIIRVVDPNRNESTEDGFTMCLFGDTTDI